MRVLVTGAAGRVGRAAVAELLAAGHEVTAADTHDPRGVERYPDGAAVARADLSDAGDTFAVVRGHDAVVHAAAIPNPSGDPPHRVFQNNLMAVFNVVEAAVRWQVSRLVNISSEAILGFVFAEREIRPEYLPVDEDHPTSAHDPYGLAKILGERLCTAATERSGLRVISLRPGWVQWPDTYETNIGPFVRDPALPIPVWSYVDGHDLAEAILLSVVADLPGHEVFYVVADDVPAGRDLAAEVARRYGDAVPVRALDRPDAAGTSADRARRLLAFVPKRSWRDYLDDDGMARPR